MSAPDLADICRRFPLSAPAAKLLAPKLSAEGFVGLLLDHQLHEDVLGVMAHALSTRLSVWWACQCAWHVGRPALPAPQHEALRVAVNWVREPSEEHRRRAELASALAGVQTPAGCIALAVFMSGGSLGPPEGPTVLPPPHLAGTSVRAAVLLAASFGDTDANQRQFVALGIDIARGKNRWDLT
jgi:hypothetical protein